MISLGDGLEAATLPLELDALTADARALADAVDPARELSVHLCGDAEIRALNRDFRARDAPTDVLSFPQEAPLLGDVVISLDTAARQARERGHGLELECRVLLAHGVAHLAGHDHHDPDEARAMAAEERRLLAVIGLEADGLVAIAGRG